MRLLVLTSVFGGYDRIFPPVRIAPEIDYVVVTDDRTLNVRGWRTHFVDATGFANARMANRYYKMHSQREFPEYDISIYVDGNIRLLGSVAPLAQAFSESSAALGIFPHPRRGSVAEEIEACLSSGKITDPIAARQELSDYLADGFPDASGLVEATILLKRHNHPDLDSAMSLWWSMFKQYQSRDQFSLPYVLWKTGLTYEMQPASFRQPNDYFGIYPHVAAAGVPHFYAYLSARAYDSRTHWLMLKLWHAKWRLQRLARRAIKQEP